jgi:hypothetical protein
MELSDFQRRMLGFPAQALGNVASAFTADPDAPAEQQDMANARWGTLGQIGAILFAAGQRQTDQGRAALLSRIASVNTPDELAMNAAQRRLMQARTQQAQTEMQRQQMLRDQLNDPKTLQSLGISAEQAMYLGDEGIRKLLENRAMANTPEAALDRRFKEAQIEHLMRPDKVAAPTPQMVDLPGGGKGWATPGSTDVVPIAGAGKGGVDPELAKRTEAEDKNLTYAKEAIAANKILADQQYSGELTSGMNQRLNMIPTMNGSWAGDKFLTGDRSANSFVDSVVRPRSGAVVGKEELENNKRIYTPSPGDTPEQLASKAVMRAQHIQSLIAGANPADRAMLQQMYQDTVAELQRLYPQVAGGAATAPGSLPKGVRSIEEVR